jgi:poly(3-hydroxyalkanoate) synthetase
VLFRAAIVRPFAAVETQRSTAEVWNDVVNNYLMGKAPPAFDILYWNQDTVRLAAGLHRDFIRLALDNSLTRAAGVSVLGTPVDLGQVDVDSYIVAGINDHIVPWENAYRSAELLGGQSRFVLSTSGHIQALVNPPSPENGVAPGDGRPVLLMPGLLAGDQTLAVLAVWLRRLDYRSFTCGFVANIDCSDRALDRVERRVSALHRRFGRRVALVGHSRGAHFARAASVCRPDQVSHAISLGADLQGMLGISAPTVAAVAAVRPGGTRDRSHITTPSSRE